MHMWLNSAVDKRRMKWDDLNRQLALVEHAGGNSDKKD